MTATARAVASSANRVSSQCEDGTLLDNPLHRALFTLPQFRRSAEILPAVQDMPDPQPVTGDREVDAVLWLRRLIGTGQADLIAKAMEAAKRIKTPLKDLEKRYTQHLIASSGGNPFAALSSFGFAGLEELAKDAIERRTLQVEASARFGDSLWNDTEAETFCAQAMKGLKRKGAGLDFDKTEVAARFMARPHLMPHTLGDCLHELTYWHQLYRLRHASQEHSGDGSPQSQAREWFVFGLLAQIPPRSRAEARAVFAYLLESDRLDIDMEETNDILMNLIG